MSGERRGAFDYLKGNGRRRPESTVPGTIAEQLAQQAATPVGTELQNRLAETYGADPVDTSFTSAPEEYGTTSIQDRLGRIYRQK